ncbi:transcriptional regulator, MerR family [Singulisphaera sp. GP187]|uniref:chaperone modulator CbpM n=1 Tax=Singulisphaera sp. GP187 TaxID=1882752 RepID=UPI00092A751D|nr:chaperone modulator CbpM [Singulisphaera sp. GP187]SIO57839.1 transcriptional regulator, MerR family [Singulisphaera sp. GP187]
MRPTTITIIPRDVVAEKLAIAPAVLMRYEARGLVRPVREGAVEGYSPAEVRRIWTILTFQRDLGINLAGVETILKLRDQMAQIHRRLDAFARELSDLIERDSGSGSGSDSNVETDA